MTKLSAGERAPLLEVKDLCIDFPAQGGNPIRAVDGVSFTVLEGETLAIVGESGSGKSTTVHGIINLLPGNGVVAQGSISLEGTQLVGMPAAEMTHIRGQRIGFVPQDPMSNLDPVWSIGFQVEEAIRANGVASGRKEIRAAAVDVLKRAGLDDAERRLKQFPHQFSGGMRQRVLIGIGLSASPKLLIADEPTSALDVTVQRTVLDHLDQLTREQGTAVILITHDLGLAAERAEKLIVMYQGKIVEAGPSRDILENPQHPYTKRLVAAAPSITSHRIQASAEVRDRTKSLIRETQSNAIVVENLSKVFSIRGKGFSKTEFTAVDDISFAVKRGMTQAIVGESGSGKTTVAKMLLGLEKPTSGTVLIDGVNPSAVNRSALFQLRRRMQPVFQDPYGSLDPLRNIANTIAEPLVTHRIGTRAERRSRVIELLDQVALPTSVMTRYPGELSGGQRQRVAIARALALKPDIVILDEAVSALDVLVQGQILELLKGLQEELNLTYLFITHDLAVVRVIADEVCVMNKGKIVESGSTDEIFAHPTEEYTRNLLDAIPGARIR